MNLYLLHETPLPNGFKISTAKNLTDKYLESNLERLSYPIETYVQSIGKMTIPNESPFIGKTALLLPYNLAELKDENGAPGLIGPYAHLENTLTL